ncbi:MAG: hypothetical protein ACREOO_04835 [bacterium]
MPMTIGTLTSNVNVVDSSNIMTDEIMEQIVKMVMKRLKEERHFEEQARQEREIYEHRSESRYY